MPLRMRKEQKKKYETMEQKTKAIGYRCVCSGFIDSRSSSWCIKQETDAGKDAGRDKTLIKDYGFTISSVTKIYSFFKKNFL